MSNAVFSSSSLGARTVSWDDRIDQFGRSPFFGSGIGTTGAAAEKAAFLNNQDPDATYYPDNSWLKVTFELGVLRPVVLLHLVDLDVPLHEEGRTKSRGHRQGLRLRGDRAAARDHGVGSLVATYLELAPMDQLFWVMITIVATMAPQLQPEIAPRTATITTDPHLGTSPKHTEDA